MFRSLRSRPPLEILLFAVALAFAVGYVGVAVFRIGYRYELEWIEGGSLAMVRRLLAGEPLYTAPSLRFVPFNYPPLYYYVSAGFARLLGGGFLPLRLVSLLASLGCAALIARHVWFETRNREAAALAAALFLATYRFAGAWLDVAHSDSLALALLLVAFYALRSLQDPWRGGIVAGVLVALSFLAKQSAAVAALPVGAAVLVLDRRRGLAFGLTAALLVAGSTWAANAATGGWYRYYVFELASRYPPDPQRAATFWSGDFLGPLGIAILGGVFAALVPGATARPGRGITFATVVGLALSTWVVHAYPATYDNVRLPACGGGALLFGLGWNAAMGAARAAATLAPRLASWVALAGLLQFSVFVYDPFAQVPNARDHADGEKLIGNLRQTPGEVLVPCHDYLVAWAGKGPQFHEMALAAVAKSGTDSTAERLSSQLVAALAEHRWSTILLDNGDWLKDEVEHDYEPRYAALDHENTFWTRTGMRRRPEVVYEPKGTPPPSP